MTIRLLVAFCHRAFASDLRTALALFLRPHSGTVFDVVVEHLASTPVDIAPSTFVQRAEPHVVVILPPTGSFSRAACGRPFGPAAHRNATHPLGLTDLANSAAAAAKDHTDVQEYAIMLYAASVHFGACAMLIAPERLGQDGAQAAASIWDASEVQQLESGGLATTAAVYLCDLL